MMLLQFYSSRSVKYRRKYLKDLNKQYGDRWCGDNPGWTPSVKVTQLHSSREEGRQRRAKGEKGIHAKLAQLTTDF